MNVPLLVGAFITYAHLGYLNLEDHELVCLYEECLIISQYFGDIVSVIQLYMLLAELKEKMYCLEESSEYLKTMLKLTEQGYEIMAVFALDLMALRYQLLCDFQKAIECYGKVINISRKLGIKMTEGCANGSLGRVYGKLGKCHKAKECSEHCVKLGKETGNKALECTGYLHLGTANISLSNWKEAISYFKKAIQIALQTGETEGLAAAYLDLGVVYQKICKLDQAQMYLEKGLKVAKESSDKEVESSCYINLGLFCDSTGKYQEAINFYQKSLSISKDIGDKHGEGKCYNNLGLIYWKQGKYHDAMECLNKGLKVYQDIGNRLMEGEIYRNLEIVYCSVGRSENSIQMLEKSLELAIETGDKKGQITCYGNMGIRYRELHEYGKALEYHYKSLNCTLEIGDKTGEGNALCSIGRDHLALGNPGEAIEYFIKSLEIATTINDKREEGFVYHHLGKAYLRMKSHDEAIKCLEESLNVGKKIGDKRIAGGASHFLGLVYYDLSVISAEEGDEEKCQDAKQKCEEMFKEALQCWEWQFTHLKDLNDFKISIVDTFIHTYKLLTKVLIKCQKTDEALLISDRGRARSLGDILVSKYGVTEERALSQPPLDSTDLESVLSSNQYCILFFAVGDQDLYAWVLTHQQPIVFVNTNKQAVKQQFEGHSNIELNLQKITINILNTFYCCMMPREMETARRENRSFDSTEDSKPPSVGSEVQPKKTGMKSGKRNVDSVDETQNETEQNSDQLEVLFSLLIAPVMQHLQHEEIVIIPDGRLFKVPFAALRDPTTGKYLSETKSIRISPSLATLKALRECTVDYHTKTGALIVGNPDVGKVMFKGETKEFDRLPSAEDEANSIAKLLNVKPLTGSQATKEMVKQKLREGVAVIHIAAHGDSDHGHIALAPPPTTDATRIPEEQDYMLTMQEVQEIGVTAQLVVLSCCHSGRGDIKAEGVVGMSRAFLAAGARAVVASLWAVDDYATSRFMCSFYASLKMGESASKSLQIAMEDIREGEDDPDDPSYFLPPSQKGEFKDYSEPQYWAPFFLIGDDVTISV